MWAQPCDADAVADLNARRSGPECIDGADDLMARHHVSRMWGQVAFGQVQVGTAHPARPDFHKQFARAWFWNRPPHGARNGRLAIGPG